MYAKKENVYRFYVSKEVILLMISKGQKTGKDKSEGSVAKSERQLGWHYLAVIKQSALLRGKTSKHHTVFLCFNFFHFKDFRN